MTSFKYWSHREEIPDGYIAGLVRDDYEHNRHVTHLYKGTFNDPGDPMCRYGWNRLEWGYSIWRNVIGSSGLCKICLRRVRENREPIPFPYETEEEDNEIADEDR